MSKNTAKGQPKQPKPQPAPAKAILDLMGIDAIYAMILDRHTLTAIAEKTGVSIGTLLAWLEATPERSARAREARERVARLWDEDAINEIRAATDQFELAKAKEVAHHYRWRAKCLAPKEYGEKVQNEVSGPNGGAVPVKVVVEFGRS